MNKGELFIDMSLDLLRRGHHVRFCAPGGSMYPTIKNNEVIGVEPVKPSQIKRGDIILYRTERGVIAHRVVRIANEPPLRASRSAKPIKGFARGAAFGLEERELRSLEAQSLSVSAPQIPPQAGCSSSEMLLKRSGRFESLASSEALLKSRRRRDAPQAKRSLIEHSALSFEHSSLSTQSSSLCFVLRGDASDTCDEPVEASQILGKVVSVERDGRVIDLNSTRTRIVNTIYIYAYQIRRTISNHIRTNGLIEKCNIGIMGWSVTTGSALTGLKERCT